MIPSLHADEIRETSELARVRALPARPEVTRDLVVLLSRHLRLHPDDDRCPSHAGDACRVCGGTGRIELRPDQAGALREAYEVGGLFAPMRVGAGKTLVTLLLPTLLRAQRPVLMAPASLIRDKPGAPSKTKRDFAALCRAWRVRLPVLLSYEQMGRAEHEARLLEIKPDLLILDEAHGVRNWDASVTRRVRRAVEAVRPRVAALSGTLLTDAILDYHHLVVWSLGRSAPVPIPRAEAEQWSQACDRRATLRRIGTGALASLPGGYHQHLRSRRGVLPTSGDDCSASIEVSIWAPALSQKIRSMISETGSSGLRPDGEVLDEWELPDCLSQLAQGFYYVWDPRPPSWWLEPRRAWRAYVRAVLDEHLDGFDSESMIVNALDRVVDAPDFRMGRSGVEGLPPCADEGLALLQAWRKVRDKFTPNTVPVWIDGDPLRHAAALARDHRAIVWTRHRAAGWQLEMLGVPYYGGGTDPSEAPRTAIACSVAAHSVGKNLQAWSSSILLAPIANALGVEQWMGRTHRPGQRTDVVRYWWPGSIPYHGECLARVMTEARSLARASGFSQKILDATWIEKPPKQLKEQQSP